MLKGGDKDLYARRLLEANPVAGNGQPREKVKREGGFRMPLHYPQYSKAEYEKMSEWMLDHLLESYGLPLRGGLREKRRFAIGAFVWSPH